MTKREQRTLLNKAVGAAFALRSVENLTGSTSIQTSGGSPVELVGDSVVFPEGDISDLSAVPDSNPTTGFYFPDGSGFAIVVDGEEVATFTSDGLTLRGSVLAGDEGTEETPSDALSNVIGVTLDAGPTSWANLASVEFATFPLTTENPVGFYVFLSEDNGAISKTEKVYFFSLRGLASGEQVFRCVPSLAAETGPTYWDILAKVRGSVATFFVRRFNGSTTTNTAACKINVAVVSEAIGAVQIKAPVTTLGGDYPTKGLEGGQVAKKIILLDPTSTGHTAFSTKQNGKDATGGTSGAVSSAQDRTLFSFPSSSPARVNGVTTEVNTDTYVPRVRWFVNKADGEKVYDWLWTNEKYAPNYIPNDLATSSPPGNGAAAHQHKMGAGTATAQTFVWPAAAPTNGSYLLQTAYSNGTHTLSYTNASSLTNAVQNFDAPNGITTIRQMTQATYDALGASRNSNTLYIIT